VCESATYQDRIRILIEKREADPFQICLSTLIKKTIISYHTIPAMYSDGSILKPNEEDPANATTFSEKQKEMTHICIPLEMVG
jgi:tRNA A37 threonylcarbamoyladenosine dehydratase